MRRHLDDKIKRRKTLLQAVKIDDVSTLLYVIVKSKGKMEKKSYRTIVYFSIVSLPIYLLPFVMVWR